MISVVLVLQTVVPLATSCIALAVITILVNRFAATRTDVWRAIVVTSFVLSAGGLTFVALQIVATEMEEDPAAGTSTLKWMATLAVSGIAFAGIVWLANRFSAKRFDKRTTLLITVVVGAAAFFSVQTAATKVWEEVEAANKEWFVLVEEGDYVRAERRLKRQIEQIRNNYGEEYPNDSSYLFHLAVVYATQGRNAEAEAIYWDTLERARSELSNHHHRYTEGLQHTARFYRRLGEFDQAEALYIEALDVTAAAQGSHSLMYSIHMWNLAWFYHLQGSFDQAEPRFLQALDILEASVEVKDQDYAWRLHELARYYKDQGAFERAESRYEQTMAILEVMTPPNRSQLEVVAKEYAELLKETDRNAGADAVIRWAKSILGEEYF